MTTPTQSARLNFEALANATVRSTMEGSNTPFRDAIGSAFSLAGNTIATADALVCGIRYYAEDWKHESANDFIMKSMKLDAKANEQSLRMKLQNAELAKAMALHMETEQSEAQ
jgi:hypothetical protein